MDHSDLREFDELESKISTKASLTRCSHGMVVEGFVPPSVPWQLAPSDIESDEPVGLFNDIYNCGMFHWLWHHRLELVRAARVLQHIQRNAVGSQWNMAYVKYLADSALSGEEK